MLYEVLDLVPVCAALMIIGGIGVLLWVITDWLIWPDRANRPPAVPVRDVCDACYVTPGRLGPGDPDNGLRGVPIIPGRGSRLVTDDDIARLERWLNEQTSA